LTGRGIKVIILERDDQIAGRARHGSCRRRRAPRTFDTTAYKGRNVVGRCFNKLKNWRGIATCYDKTARSDLGGVTLDGRPDLDPNQWFTDVLGRAAPCGDHRCEHEVQVAAGEVLT
jgi:hypothetical protein